MFNRIDFYKERIEKKEKEFREYKNRYNFISFLRLLDVALIIFFLAYWYFGSNFKIVSAVGSVIGVVIFIFLAKWHEGIDELLAEINNSIQLNTDDIKRNNGEWKEFKDTGKEYLDIKHKFAGDLDVFGDKSFFQWINATKTPYGREILKNKLLLNEYISKNEIYKTQEALKELGKKVELRERFLSALISNKKRTEKSKHYLIEWAKERNHNILSSGIYMLRIVAPVITVLTLILSFSGKINFLFFLSIFIINLAIISTVGKQVNEGLELFEELKYKISGYVKALEILENEEFKSDKLNQIKRAIINGEGASKSLKKLYNMSSWLNDRGNAFYFVLNGILYWDYQILCRAEKWKEQYGEKVEEWMNALGEFEALESLSVLANEEYTLPTINDDLIIEAEKIVHPMIVDNGVRNSFRLDEQKRVALITGSNMSGKSTFLRTIGFSMFLSYLGLGVKAQKFSLPIVNIYTCMRTGDNLNESISSFYAEILRVKSIVEGAKKGERIMFLLDEIFKGTNSLDRHEGAEVLINQLLKGKSIGLVSTHDLELCNMEEKQSEIINYNFREYYENNKLRFDYKLRKGISTTRNARYLMKMAGIEIDT